MKAPGRLDRRYRGKIKEARLDRLMLQVLGGPEGVRAVGAILKAERAIRFAAGRATKLDRFVRDWDARRAKQQLREGGES